MSVNNGYQWRKGLKIRHLTSCHHELHLSIQTLKFIYEIMSTKLLHLHCLQIEHLIYGTIPMIHSQQYLLLDHILLLYL